MLDTTSTTPPTTTTVGGSGACSATYALVGQWGGGFQGEVMVHAASTPVSKWKVSWTFPGGQTVSQLWSGKYTGSGSMATVTNEAWNGSIAANGHTTFGFTGTGAVPATVQNLSCTTA